MLDFIPILRQHLPRFKKVLELGSKNGDCLKLIHEYYDVTASETQKVKTRYLKDEFIDIRVILLDPITVDTHKRVECVFSKNCLDELSLVEINESLKNQLTVLTKDGLIFHIFDESKIDKNEILTLVNENYEILQTDVINKEFFVLAKKNW